MAMPGNYSVTLERRVDDTYIKMGDPQTFSAQPLGAATLSDSERADLLEFQQKTARLQKAVLGSIKALEEAERRLSHLKQAIFQTPAADQSLYSSARDLENWIRDLQVKLSGDPIKRGHNEPTPPSISERVRGIVSGHWSSTSAPTETQRDTYTIAAEEFEPVLSELQTLINSDLKDLEDQVEAAGGPWTPGRVPKWE
jgi:hypothetical protein